MTEKKQKDFGDYLSDKISPKQIKILNYLKSKGFEYDEPLTYHQRKAFQSLENKGIIEKTENEYGIAVWKPLMDVWDVIDADKETVRHRE